MNWKKNFNKYSARITICGKEIHLGLFENIEDAISARKEAEDIYHNPIIEEFKNIANIRSLNMKKIKNLNLNHKQFLQEQGLKPMDFKVERDTSDKYVFINIHTGVLWDFYK